MSDFIHDLENELRAASTRRLRLAAARAPRPPANLVALAASVAVCIAVAAALLVGHGGQTNLKPDSPSSTPGITTPSPTHNPIVTDCLKHGSLTRHYTASQLRRAFKDLTASQRKYTNCPSVITTALRHGSP